MANSYIAHIHLSLVLSENKNFLPENIFYKVLGRLRVYFKGKLGYIRCVRVLKGHRLYAVRVTGFTLRVTGFIP